MPKPREDLTGQTFGFLRVLDLAYVAGGHGYWRCRCVRPKANGKPCNAIVPAARDNKLREGRQISCGCERADPEVRRTARMTIPAKRRRQIAQMGSSARYG